MGYDNSRKIGDTYPGRVKSMKTLHIMMVFTFIY